MWALRRARASLPLRNRGITSGNSYVSFADLEIPSTCGQVKNFIIGSPQPIADKLQSFKRTYDRKYASASFFLCRNNFSSQAGEKDDLDDGFSELEGPAVSEAVQDGSGEDEEELISDPDLSDDEVEPSQNELELSEIDIDSSEKKSPKKRAPSALFKAIMEAPGQSVQGALDKWIEEGHELSKAEVSMAVLSLRKFRIFGKALQLLEWVEEKKEIEFVERDYVSMLDLIAKVRGIQKAESYIQKIPQSFRGEIVYRTLLANCVMANNAKKTEEVFNKMKDLEFPITVFACNQMLLLYKRLDKKKIADVLLLMEKENLKPSLFTYKLLIDTKGQSHDITGMDQIYETMKAEGVEPDLHTKAILAKHYATGGLKEKAEAVLKEMEGGNLNKNRWACRNLLPLYAELGKADDVSRIWKVCEQNPRLEECTAAIEAWGKLNKIEEAEAVFEKMMNIWKKPNNKHYSMLLKVYANHKMLAKGKDLIKRMADSGCKIGPLTWDALVKLYVTSGEVEKADSILQKASQQSKEKPLFSSYIVVMDQYAARGDIHNTEKIFHRMRQAGYMARLRQFGALIQAYVNAKSPAYGIRERMKADNIFPNKYLMGQLAQVDAFRKTPVSDLLD